MLEHLHDKHAGNLGDHLKHYHLIEMISKIVSSNPRSIAYIDTHAGAGQYTLQKEHWKNRFKYRGLVGGDERGWMRFDRLQHLVEVKRYYLGSFVLVGRLLAETHGITFKPVLYENNVEAVTRIKQNSSRLLPGYELGPLGESNPGLILQKIRELKAEGFEKIICLIDPYWEDGKGDAIWCPILGYDDPHTSILLFDYARARPKEGRALFPPWHCDIKAPIGVARLGIKGYALFGNSSAENLLRRAEHTG